MEDIDMMQMLPEDLLADVLRRLPPRSLATARCVRKSWCAIINTRRLMDLLPLSLAGFFINFNDHQFSEFFARPSLCRISGKLHQLHTDFTFVQDHCNGLLLFCCGDYVVNPATRRWAALPPCPPQLCGLARFSHKEYIVFDPTISSHYEVITIPQPWRREEYPTVKEWEWPPSPFMLHVFSSRANRWEERSFVRQGEAIGTVADMQLALCEETQYAVYWRGELYVHHHFLLMRISLSSGKYQLINLPEGIDVRGGNPEFRLGRSEKGVYFASLAMSGWLQVWFLHESSGHIEWVLKHQADIDHILAHRYRNYNERTHGSWIMRDINYNLHRYKFPHDIQPEPLEDKSEWDSENEDVLDTKEKVDGPYKEDVTILGFHPLKEVIFLSESLKRGLAYHFNTSKVQDLGNLYPTRYSYFAGWNELIEKSFPYTPCWTGKFPDNN